MKTYNDTTYAILGILTTNCKSGYEIKKFIDQSLNHFWKISYGQIYPTLKLLVQDGLAEVQTESVPGKPASKDYHLTTKGMELLKKWLAQPTGQLPVERNEILLKLFFGRQQSEEQSRILLQDYKQELKKRYFTYEAIERSIMEHEEDEEDTKYWLFTLDYGKRSTQAAIDWCHVTLAQLSTKEE
ncbi:PadR family transcriptional regulator [Gracilibacillus salinarum]|uniref:PadR family transcriptional regulator n=1 Tax=Gracilibacillus salinarum TaxID=2932255 RepID=A0ABY4GI52_9BACI|nr:PadR family transcriptional regulator [Gracilibacillus salinarum]UOQ83447.1 PadR family transcriptional regulator [Gracilibacillus salinarum]